MKALPKLRLVDLSKLSVANGGVILEINSKHEVGFQFLNSHTAIRHFHIYTSDDPGRFKLVFTFIGPFFTMSHEHLWPVYMALFSQLSALY